MGLARAATSNARRIRAPSGLRALAQEKARQAVRLLRAFRPTLARWRMHEDGIARWLLLIDAAPGAGHGPLPVAGVDAGRKAARQARKRSRRRVGWRSPRRVSGAPRVPPHLEKRDDLSGGSPMRVRVEARSGRVLKSVWRLPEATPLGSAGSIVVISSVRPRNRLMTGAQRLRGSLSARDGRPSRLLRSGVGRRRADSREVRRRGSPSVQPAKQH
jgi:hypothetical protein